jgi:hypothetical protein
MLHTSPGVLVKAPLGSVLFGNKKIPFFRFSVTIRALDCKACDPLTLATR